MYFIFLLILVNPVMIARNLDDRFVDVTLNEFCQKSNENYTVLVSFGVFDTVGVCQVEYKESMVIWILYL